MNSLAGTSVIYSVSSIKDINNVIIPHFDKYPLLTQKRPDFLLFRNSSKMAIGLINEGAHLTTEGLTKIVSYQGAIAILFLFTLMLINIRTSELVSYVNNSLPLYHNVSPLTKS